MTPTDLSSCEDISSTLISEQSSAKPNRNSAVDLWHQEPWQPFLLEVQRIVDRAMQSWHSESPCVVAEDSQA
jgi:hypothetical protein